MTHMFTWKERKLKVECVFSSFGKEGKTDPQSVSTEQLLRVGRPPLLDLRQPWRARFFPPCFTGGLREDAICFRLKSQRVVENDDFPRRKDAILLYITMGISRTYRSEEGPREEGRGSFLSSGAFRKHL